MPAIPKYNRPGIRVSRAPLGTKNPRKPQISPLRYSGFPVEIRGPGQFHRLSFWLSLVKAAHGCVQRSKAGNPGALCPATALHGGATLPFVIKRAAGLSRRAVEGSAVSRTLPGNVFRPTIPEFVFSGRFPGPIKNRQNFDPVQVRAFRQIRAPKRVHPFPQPHPHSR